MGLSLFVGLTGSVVLAAVAPTLPISPDVLLVKPGLTIEVKTRELAQCKADTRKLSYGVVQNPLPPGVNPGTGKLDTSATNVVGTVLGVAIVGAMNDHKLRSDAYERCVRDHGYKVAHLSVDDAAAYRRLRTADEREAWEAAFFSSARFERAVSPLTPPFPDAEADDFVLGGVLLARGSLSIVAADGVRQPGQVVARARGRFLAVGKLAEGFTYAPAKVEVAPGETFYQVSSRNAGNHIVATAWCGAAKAGGSACLISDYDGYGVVANPARAGVPIYFDGVVPKGRMATPLTVTDIGKPDQDLEIEFRLARLDRKAVELDAYAVANGKDYLIHKALGWFDKSGTASTLVGDVSLAFTIDPAEKRPALWTSLFIQQVEPLKP